MGDHAPNPKDVEVLAHLFSEGLPAVDHLREPQIAAMTSAFIGPDAAANHVPQSRRRASMFSSMYVKIGAGAAAAVLATAGMAMAGALPTAAQDALAKAASHAGISLPHSTRAGGSDGTSGDDRKSTHGDGVSDVAHDTSLTGKAKGTAVSTVAKTQGAVASAGHAQKGRDTAAAQGGNASSSKPTTTPPVSTGKPSSTPGGGKPTTTPAPAPPAPATPASGKPDGTPGQL